MKKLCTKSGCKTLVDVTDSRCPKHPFAGRGERKSNQYSWDANYYTNRWKKLRLTQMTKNPLCENCLAMGMTRPGAIADHIKEARDHPELFFSLSNLQTLCHGCHSHKTTKERRKRAKGNYKAVGDFMYSPPVL